MIAGAELIAHARGDWAIVLRGLARAGATLAAGGEPPAAKALAMAQRMVARWAVDGAAALAWAGAPLDPAEISRGPGGAARASWFAGLTIPADLPPALAAVARAFADDADRGAASIALFLEAARRAAEVADQLGLAAPLAPAAAIAARRLTAALHAARVRGFRPHRRRDADFDRVRAVGYVAAAPAGRVVEVRVPGLAWRGHVLRKADVILSERAEVIEQP